MAIRSVLRGVGSYLPSQILTNIDLQETVQTSDAWIRERTGIGQRHIVADGETTSDLGYEAALKALDAANMSAKDIDLIICATTTPDYTFPSTATLVQERLDMHHGAAFDVQAVCSGFIYALKVADSMIRTGNGQNVLVIGAETLSCLLDWEDRTTCVLFGDGAGAFVLSAQDVGDLSIDDAGILNTFIRSDGRYQELLYVDGGPSKTGTVGQIRMAGKQVFRHAVNEISNAILACADGASIPIAKIDWFVPHQANQRILNGVAKQLNLKPEKVISTVEFHANTSAASVPLAFDSAMSDGRIKSGDLVMLAAFGGGFTWGAILLRV